MIEIAGLDSSYVVGTTTKAIQGLTNGIVDISKGPVSTDSAGKLVKSVYKGLKGYAKGDFLCTGLCATSGVFETAAGVVVWLPITGKIFTVAALKSASKLCMTIRDLSAGGPTNPLC